MKNKMVIKAHVLVFILIGFLYSCSKPITHQAHSLYNKMAYMQAIDKYNLVVGKDSTNAELLSRLADCYRLTNQTVEAELWYSKLVQLPDAQPISKLYYGQALMRNGKYEQAKFWMNTFKSQQPEDGRGEEFIEAIQGLDNFFENKDSYSIRNLGINSKADDFSPTMYNNGIIFASSRVNENLVRYNHAWNDQPFTKIYYSKGVSENLSSPELFDKSIQTKYHDGAAAFTNDGNEIYFTRNNIVKGKVYKSKQDIVKLKIFTANKTDFGWSNPIDFPSNSNEYHCAHPTISADGTRLYFSSDMPNGEGGMDLYVCSKTGNGWGLPINLGSKVNTKGNEIFPYIDNKNTLYFASNGHKGLGGLDNYYVNIDNETWSEPINIGSPINTKYDDFGIVFNNENTGGYFSSDRPGGVGQDDIYSFERLNVPVYLAVLVYDKESNEPLNKVLVQIVQNTSRTDGMTTGIDGKIGKEIELNQNFEFKANKSGYKEGVATLSASGYDADNVPYIKIPLEKVPSLSVNGTVTTLSDNLPVDGSVVVLSLIDQTNNITKEYKTGPDGKFHFDILPNANYTLSANKDQCKSSEEKVSTIGVTGSQIFTVNLGMFCVGDIIKIDNIYYDLDKYYIRPDAALELNKLVATMVNYPNLKIELRSHTDSRGSDAYNEKLSGNRAKSAVSYLVTKGINKERMVAKGYGETVLTNRCSNGVKCSKEEHQTNRRTEFKILSID